MRFLAVIALAALAACTPLEQVIVNTADKQASFKDNIFYAADGAALPYLKWLPTDKPKAVIVALHGFNDYSNAFAIPGEFFRTRGIAFYAYDQRGFGAAPLPGIWGSEGNLTRDLRQFVSVVRKQHPKTPLYILGESMGGAVTVAALTDSTFPEVDGVILVAPALWGGDTMNPLYRTMLWSMAHMMPFTEFTGKDIDVVASDNIPLLRKMGADPLIIKATRADAIYGLVQLMDDAYTKVPQLRTHTLMLYGACDEIIPHEPIAKSITRFSVSPKFAYYPEGFHMMLRDTQGEVVMEDILSWIENPDEKIPSGWSRRFVPPQNSLDRKRCRKLINWSSGSPNRDQKGIGPKP